MQPRPSFSPARFQELRVALLTTSFLTALTMAAGCDPALPVAAPQLTVQHSEPRDSTLLAGADTYLRQGNPSQNQGTESVRKLQASGKNRALLWWDPQAIVGAVGGDWLAGARLELTVALNADNWGSSGRTIDLYRLTQAWTELGATWNRANDTNTTNPVADCSGETAWDMDGPNPRPWVTTPTATQLITNGLRGVVTFDVTADVAGLLGGGTLPRWILKKTDEGASGRVDFGARESDRPPIPDSFTYPSDTTPWVAPPARVPSDTLARYYRTVIGVRFDDSGRRSTRWPASSGRSPASPAWTTLQGSSFGTSSRGLHDTLVMG